MVVDPKETDRISELPDDIIGRILFFLPAKDAACTTILCKKWKHVWDLLPILNFRSSDSLPGKRVLLKQDGSLDDHADEYMDLIDDSLEKLRHFKVRFELFRLDLFDGRDTRHASRFNQLMELANKNSIRELVIHGLVSDPRQNNKPSLPVSTFASTNLFGVVDLKDCVFRPELLKDKQPGRLFLRKLCLNKVKLLEDKPRFPCLRKLCLYQVKFLREKMVGKLLKNCPLLEEFSLEICQVWRVHIRDHPKLHNVRIVGVGTIRIKAKNIEKFHCDYKGLRPLNLDFVSCEKLKELRLYSNFRVEYIQKLVARSPVLETLTLRLYFRLERLTISSMSLKTLYLYTDRCGGAKEVEIDAPNLEFYKSYYLGPAEEAFTSPVFKTASLPLPVAQPWFYLGTDFLPTDSDQWFISFKNCLESFEYNALGIYVIVDTTNKDSILENLRRIPAVAPVYTWTSLESLSVYCDWGSFNFSSLLDCCFLIYRPKYVYVYSSCDFNTDSIDLRDKLISWEENQQCCRGSRRKCWRHDLEDVKVMNIITMELKNIWNGSSGDKEMKRITLHLKWKLPSSERRIHSAAAAEKSQGISPPKQRPRHFPYCF